MLKKHFLILITLTIFLIMNVFSSTFEKSNGKIDAELEKKLNTLQLDAKIPVLIFLTEQPFARVCEEVKKKYTSQYEALAKQAISDEKNALIQLDALNATINHEIGQQLEKIISPQQDILANYISGIGDRVVHRLRIFNALSAVVTVKNISTISQRTDVLRISEDQIMQAQLNTSAPAINAPTWWVPGGYTGGTIDVGILDSGMDTSHPAFSGKTITSHIDVDLGKLDVNWNDDATSSDDFQGHGTCVGGIVMSNDATYRGVAYGLDKTYNLKSGWRNTGGTASMYWGDAIDNVDWAYFTADPAEVFNHSYGGLVSVDDTDMARFWDSVVDNCGCMVAISAGNDGPSGYTLGSPSIFYNGICVANINDNNTQDRSDDTIYISSSRGPTQDGRKKPDLAAPGTNIYSPMYNWEGVSSDFGNWTGTSMSSPHIAGAMVIMRQRLGVISPGEDIPRVIKAILINSADDKGTSGWDSAYGWGYIELGRAYNQFAAYNVNEIYPSGQAGDYKFYKGTLNTNEKATLVWNRRVDYEAGGNYPITYFSLPNIDLFLYNMGNNSQISFSTSTIDNVEQVVSSGNYDVVVKVESISASFPARSPERFALATSQVFQLASSPSFTVTVNFGKDPVETNEQFNVQVVVENYGGVTAHNISVTLNLPGGFSIVSGANPQGMGPLPSFTGNQVSWTVQATSTPGDYIISASVASNSYGESYSGSGQDTITVSPPAVIDWQLY